MRFLFIPFLFFVIPLNAQNSLKAGYTFGANYNDVVGSNHLNMNGEVSPTSDRFGNENCAYYFPGVTIPNSSETQGDTSAYFYIDVPNEDLNVNYMEGWSLSLWYKGGSSDLGDLEHIFTRSNNPENNSAISCYEILLYDLNTPLISVFKDFPNTNGSNYIWAEQNENNLDSSIWHHAVLVVNSTSEIAFYIDNVLQDTISSPSIFDDCESKLWIGYDFEGKIDDIYYYQSALNDTQVDSLFTAQSSCTVTGVNTVENSEDEIEVYPNPSFDYFTVSISNKWRGSTIEIYNTVGKKVLYIEVTSSKTIINTSNLVSGIYYVKLIDNEQNSNLLVKKIIVQ